MAGTDGESIAINPGARLQTARQRAGLSVVDAAARLRLPPDTLEALEAGRLQALGASVIVRGHLRRYAALVGIAPHEILDDYDAWAGRLASQPDLRAVITDPAMRSGVRRLELRSRHAVIAAVVIVLLALVSWARHYAPKTAALQSPGVASPSHDPAP